MSHERDDILLDDQEVTRGAMLGWGEPSDQELEAVNAHTRRPLSRDAVYIVDAKPSDTSRDDRYTRMDPDTTLANYAEDAAEGVPILNTHGVLRGNGGLFGGGVDLPIGRSFAGQLLHQDYKTPRGVTVHATKTKPAVYSAFYLPRGMTTSVTSNDDLIRAIDAGVLTDVSVGFGNTKPRKNGYWYRCDECGEDGLRSDECTHFPGMQIKNTKGDVRRVVWAVVDAGLKEYSPVWRGSNPSAQMLRKAGDLVTRGVLSHADIEDIDRVTGRRMAAQLDWQALKGRRIVSNPERTPSPHDTTPPAGTPDPDEARRDVLDEALAGEQPPAPPAPPVPPEDQRVTPPPAPEEHPWVATLRTAGVVDDAGLQSLLHQAEDGKRYRTDLEGIFHKAGVRAYGTAYRQDAHARTLAAASTDDLLSLIDERNQVARERFAKDVPGEDKDPSRQALAARYGGRQTLPTTDPLGGAARTDRETPGGVPTEDRDSELYTVQRTTGAGRA